MVSDVPFGCFLSGGVDSSAVLSFMAEQACERVKTFSIGFPQSDYSELAFARVVAGHFGTDHHEYVLEPDAVGILEPVGHCVSVNPLRTHRLFRRGISPN